MKKLVTLLLLVLSAAGFLAGQDDRALMEKAKLLIFDKSWQEALGVLEAAVRQYPASPLYDSFVFYKANCLEELRRWQPALAAYDEYLRISKKESFREEAQCSRIDISLELYKAGEPRYLKNVIDLLQSPDKVLRYYAAIKLSYNPDRSVAAPALPVLQRILEQESDTELRDKAKLAIARIDPAKLPAERPAARQSQLRMLRIEIREKGKTATMSLSVPLALADLALRSLDDRTKAEIRKQGLDIDQLLRQIGEKGGTIFELKDEETQIKIWIE